MAEIPVVRKEGSSFPKWLIPLLLLLLLLPLLYFCSRSNVADNTNYNGNRAATTNADNSADNMRNTGNATAVGNTGNTAIAVNNNDAAAINTDGRARSGAVIKDVNEFGSASDKGSLVGRGFFVNGVRVNRVLSDKIFTVNSSAGEMYVMLGENLDSSGGKENQIRMRRGQTVNLGGEFRNVPTNDEVAQETKGGGLSKNEYGRMKGQEVYVHANSVSDAK
jgi:hypothetical protein